MKDILYVENKIIDGVKYSVYLLEIVTCGWQTNFERDIELKSYYSSYESDSFYLKKFLQKSNKFKELYKWFTETNVGIHGLLRRQNDLWGVHIIFPVGSLEEMIFILKFDVLKR